MKRYRGFSEWLLDEHGEEYTNPHRPWERKWFTCRPVPYHWVLGWRDKHRHCMNVSLANARTARKVAPDQIGRYARQAMAHYREMRKHERMMATYE